MSLGALFNSQFSLMQVLEFFLRILMAGFCGAVIGFERTRRFKEAGIRTHVIVSAAAALIMIVSKYGFADIAAGAVLGAREADPSRIAAQVVSGISFLCAGVIFKNGSSIKSMRMMRSRRAGPPPASVWLWEPAFIGWVWGLR